MGPRPVSSTRQALRGNAEGGPRVASVDPDGAVAIHFALPKVDLSRRGTPVRDRSWRVEEKPNAPRLWTTIVVLLLLGVPGAVLRFSGIDVDPVAAAAVFGVGIVAGAFLLSWAAEVAELDVSASLAIALLALIAVLPEYAIEAVLAWDAGSSFDTATGAVTDETSRVAANVTGSNRLLIGLGWSAVILIYWVKRGRVLDMRGEMGLEIAMLTIATAATALIFFVHQVHILLAAGLIVLYVAYLWISSTGEAEEPDLIGAAALIGSLPTRWRRTMVVFLFVFAAGVILVAAEPFVDSLIETGQSFGIDEFILIQWVAPLASEAPEIIVAVLFSLRANPVAGLTALISAEVNQLTLLVGSMAVLFSASAGEILSFPLDDRQGIEFLLTTAVSVAGLMLVAKRVISWNAGVLLLVLFAAHLFFPDPEDRLRFSFVYFGIALGLAAMDWRRVALLFREEPQELE